MAVLQQDRSIFPHSLRKLGIVTAYCLLSVYFFANFASLPLRSFEVQFASPVAAGTVRRINNTENGELDVFEHPLKVVVNPLKGKFAVSTFQQITRNWNRSSTYEDILQLTTPLESFHSTQTHFKRRKILIMHCLPKMASTTLRRACWENLRSTCGVVSPKRDPMGYFSMKDLSRLISKCDRTHHFCVMGGHVNSENFPNMRQNNVSSSLTNVEFVHLFPFRNFDNWSRSALKQIFVGHSDAGCRTTYNRLDSCSSFLELDYSKYSKPAISGMIRSQGNVKLNVSKRENATQIDPIHHFLLYNSSQLLPTLIQLSFLFKLPMLPYIEMKYKHRREEGTCADLILRKFHDCFDDKLANESF
mmetsp:Transcript_1407/g.3120  ORF Transcript_1407/g.3120 Transcript_1407/m.3120 type:complete len:360 (-) Transcript_1407:49-1128(-)